MSAPDLSPELLGILRCPHTLQSLRLATAEELERLPQRLAAALIREDGLAAYPIRDGFPALVPDAMIPLGPAPFTAATGFSLPPS